MSIHDYKALNQPSSPSLYSSTIIEDHHGNNESFENNGKLINQENINNHMMSDQSKPIPLQQDQQIYYESQPQQQAQQPQSQSLSSTFQLDNNYPDQSRSIWNISSSKQTQQQPRRSSVIDSSHIWGSGPTNSGNIWSSSQSSSTITTKKSNLPPPLTTTSDNYTSSNQHQFRSSLISDILTSPIGPFEEQQSQICNMEYSNSSPKELTDSFRRHSYTDGYTNGNNNLTDSNILQMVDEYFESDPHERVKVTMKLLNDRFFDDEKSLNDAYQLPKFPIESSLRNYQLILVGFKAGRIDVFYLPTNTTIGGSDLMNLKIGDLVIVEADRGRDLGKVFKMNVSIDEARLLKLLQFQEQQAALNEHVDNSIIEDLSIKPNEFSTTSSISPPTLHFPKSVLSLAQSNEIFQILNKKQDEEKACRLCLAKIANATNSCILGAPTSPATQDLLQMKLIDSEYQFDRKKLIFYYSTTKRIDFRDLVRELFRIYKTRIWMCAVIGLPYQISRKNSSPLSSSVNLNSTQFQQRFQGTNYPQWSIQQKIPPQQELIPRGFNQDYRQQLPTFQPQPTNTNTFIPIKQQQQLQFQQQTNQQQTKFEKNDENNNEEENLGESSTFVLKSLVDSINH